MKTNNVKVYRTTSESTETKILIGISIEITGLSEGNSFEIENELKEKAGNAAIGIFTSSLVNDNIILNDSYRPEPKQAEEKVSEDKPKPQPVHKEAKKDKPVAAKPQAVKMTDDIVDPEPEPEPETEPEAEQQTNEEPVQEEKSADDDEW